MKISKVLFAFVGCQTTSYALPLSDELKALSNFDSWADSVTSSVPFFSSDLALGRRDGSSHFNSDLWSYPGAMASKVISMLIHQSESVISDQPFFKV